MAASYHIKACRFCGAESSSPVAHQRYCSLVCAFWSGIRKDAACWNWTKGLMSAGYGYVDFQSTRHWTHRLSWEIARGPIPEGMSVLHDCDNPRCVNPDHLFVGTQKDNRQDCVAKLRHNFGTLHGMCKLTEQEVLDIRASFGPRLPVAKKYGISVTQVGDIRHGKSWRHL